MEMNKRHIISVQEDDNTFTIVYEKDTEEEQYEIIVPRPETDDTGPKETYEKNVRIVMGPPCAGKSTYVANNAQAGDLIWDFDLVHAALANTGTHEHIETIRKYVFALRQALYNELKEDSNISAWIINGSPLQAVRQSLAFDFNAQIIYINTSKDDCIRTAENKRPTEWLGYIDTYFADFEAITDEEKIVLIAKDEIMEARAITGLNKPGTTNAAKQIKAGSVNIESKWSFSSADGNKILGDDDWAKYSAWHLGIDANAEEDTKGRYGYPFGKDGKVYRSALIAIRQRAGQTKEDEIFEAAGKLLTMVDERELQKAWEGKPKDMEKRFFDVKIETRETTETETGGKPVVVGHAALFNTLSEDLGGFREKINPGAFDGVLDNDVRAFFNHDPNYLLARTESGTLRLGVDEWGLVYEFDVPDTTAGRDLMVSMERGDISQSSFAFNVLDDDWETTPAGEVRTINKVARLYDVSPVSIPAYPDTNDLQIAKRNLVAHKDKQKLKKEIVDETRRSLRELKLEILKLKLEK